jgi:hypothetical protein
MKLTTIANKIKNNELLLIGIITILILIWIVLYLIPNIFVDLFNTFLGKAILILIIILISFKNLYQGMLLLIIFVIIYRFVTLSIYTNKASTSVKEGFTLNKPSINKFLEIQKLINPEIVFDMKEIQKQSSQDEIDYFNKNGQWPWSEKVKELYKEALDNNPYVRTSAEDAINTVRTIYNENAILEMLSWQTKEGQFLLNGVSVNTGKSNPYQDLPSGWGDYAYKSKQITRHNNIIKCGKNLKPESNPNINTDELTLQEIVNMGNDGIVYSHVKKINPVDYNNLEKLIPGFSFLKGPCNPCQALNNPPNYSCPFELNIRDTKKGVSPVWNYLWSKN